MYNSLRQIQFYFSISSRHFFCYVFLEYRSCFPVGMMEDGNSIPDQGYRTKQDEKGYYKGSYKFL